jgi:hypothetical protein
MHAALQDDQSGQVTTESAPTPTLYHAHARFSPSVLRSADAHVRRRRNQAVWLTTRLPPLFMRW